MRGVCQKIGIAEMIGAEGTLAVEWSVEGDDMAAGLQFAQMGKSGIAFALCSWRVAKEYLKSHLFRPSCHNGSHMAHAHHAQSQILGAADALVDHPLPYRCHYPLCHSGSVASRSIHHLDTGSAAVIEVDVVGADGGSGYHLYGRMAEERLVAFGSGARDEHLCIAERLGVDLGGFEVAHLCVGLQQALNVGNMAFDDDFHREGNIFRS